MLCSGARIERSTAEYSAENKRHIKHPFVRDVVKPEVQGGLNELSFSQ